MKKFETYQYVDGPMTDRDKLEAGSKFWNKGKWDNYVLPFLPEDCSDLTLVDVGCNAGLFLELAEKKGFKRVIGVDSNRGAIKRAMQHKKDIGGKYELCYKDMKEAIKALPPTDYLVMANTHYYLTIDEWLDFMDELHKRVCHIIIVTADKSPHYNMASADITNIRRYFKNWDEVGFVDQLPLEGDPFPRVQWSLCFKNRDVERVPIETLNRGNRVQEGFYIALDEGINPLKTRYYRILRTYRDKWSVERLMEFINGKKDLYEDVKKNGIQKPLIINPDNRVLDGNHRCRMLERLGYKNVIVRRT
jgi:SAM-dependent methyltransferase